MISVRSLLQPLNGNRSITLKLKEKMNRHCLKQIIGSGVLIAAIFSGTGLRAQVLNEQTLKFGTVLEGIRKYYVDSTNQELLTENAIRGLLKDLDPHSSYLTPREVEQMNEPLQGNFEGIGVTFNILNDTVYIISPVTGGPSEKAGILAGDRIIKVDGKNIAGASVTNEQVFSLLKGKKGTQVDLSILRKGAGMLDFTVLRDKIPIYSVDASYNAGDGIGYIKLNRFSMTTMDEFQDAIKKLKSGNLKSLILDLTGNGGGYLEVAINLADQFLDDGKLVLYTQGVNSPKKEYFATREGSFEKGHLIILIDEGSASASEIVTGAIQDWDRGIIVGRRSYGKGLVQKPMLLPDQSMIRLTIAKYYTPTGRLIQKPYKMSRDDYDKDLVNRYLKGEMAHRDSIHFPDSLKYYTLKNTRLVYGGGGIMPDYFVSIDTSYYSEYYRQLMRKGLLNRFVLEYVDENRTSLHKIYPGFMQFKDNFLISNELMNRLYNFTASNGVVKNDKDIALSGNQIKLLLKAYIARDLWSNNEFYEIANENDPKYETAMNILRNWDKYEVMLLNTK
jgi:carboxyl-terminal processing protease